MPGRISIWTWIEQLGSNAVVTSTDVSSGGTGVVGGTIGPDGYFVAAFRDDGTYHWSRMWRDDAELSPDLGPAPIFVSARIPTVVLVSGTAQGEVQSDEGDLSLNTVPGQIAGFAMRLDDDDGSLSEVPTLFGQASPFTAVTAMTVLDVDSTQRVFFGLVHQDDYTLPDGVVAVGPNAVLIDASATLSLLHGEPLLDTVTVGVGVADIAASRTALAVGLGIFGPATARGGIPYPGEGEERGAAVQYFGFNSQAADSLELGSFLSLVSGSQDGISAMALAADGDLHLALATANASELEVNGDNVDIEMANATLYLHLRTGLLGAKSLGGGLEVIQGMRLVDDDTSLIVSGVGLPTGADLLGSRVAGPFLAQIALPSVEPTWILPLGDPDDATPPVLFVDRLDDDQIVVAGRLRGPNGVDGVPSPSDAPTAYFARLRREAR